MIGRAHIRMAAATILAAALAGRAEVVLQYFNTSWAELTDKIPELAEAGYGALWLPPPTKGSGGLSVGYDLWDPFDLGGKDQRGTVRTRYGTEAELLRLIETAHRFGIRVYVDTIMNHRAFDVPGYNEFTPIDLYPGLVPEDFHLRKTEDGFYRKWDNVSNWQDVWQVQNRNFSDLIDLAQETPNANFGRTEGSTHPKIRLVRHPNNPELYDFHPTLGRVGFGSTNITTAVIATNPGFFEEDVGGYLMRSIRWLVARTKLDGLRLDAVKHVPSYFFGDQNPATKNTNDVGYTGQAQAQFNLTRGFSDSNHRDAVFNTDAARDDLMMFGEHLGAPPSYGEYFDAGMRLVDATLKGKLNDLFGNPSAGLWNLDQPGYSGDPAFNDERGVMFSKSHDDDYVIRPELHHAYYLTRKGLPNIYTDGNYQSETLAQSGGAFPRHANTAFLGQFGDRRLPNLVYLHDHFARGDQAAKLADADVVAYERRDKREGAMSDADGTVMLFMLNDNYAAGQARAIATTFPRTPFVDDTYLYNYSSYGGGFYVYASAIAAGSVIVPPGGYFAFAPRTPEEADPWRLAGGSPVTICQDGAPVTGTVQIVRRDGPAGDPGFNPYDLPDANTTDYAYTMPVPRVTSPTNLRFAARADGSAVNVLLKLDGGWDLNSQMGLGDLAEPAKRDNPPGINPTKGTEVFLGYEQPRFVLRQYREKFAARNTESNNVIGSQGAETYQCVIGSAEFTVNTGVVGRDSDAETAQWVYHDPQASVTATGQSGAVQFAPAPQSAAGSNVTVWLKVGVVCDINRAFLYYTTDGQTYPEGAGGEGLGLTRVAELAYVAPDQAQGTVDWWRGTLPAMTNGTALRYKIGVSRRQEPSEGCSPAFAVVAPTTAVAVATKKSMMGVWEIANFNAAAAVYKPHVDYGASVTGLVEGLHVLRARAFLDRSGKASLYNTFVQTFYYDVQTPQGQVVYPANDGDDLGSQEYGVVVRTDPTVREVWIHIADADPANDDGATGAANGNGTNALGQAAWAPAAKETPSLSLANAYPDQWRFTYRNIPATNTATILARLREWSSSTNLLLLDEAGHFRTLTRVADARAPAQRLFVAFPPADGVTINDQDDYVMKAWFSTSLADGLGLETLRNRFLVRIDGQAQPVDRYTINYLNVSNLYHELAYPLPDLFDGDTNRLHNIQVTHTTGGGVVLEASRTIRAKSERAGPYVAIVYPPEVDSDGQPYRIVLPDVAAPTPEQRSVPITVETDRSASNLWIEFDQPVGSGVARVESTVSPVAGLADVTAGEANVVGRSKPLAGLVTVPSNGLTVAGAGTQFTNELRAGDTLRIGGVGAVVSQVVSQTSLRLMAPFGGPGATNAAAAQDVRFDVDFHSGDVIRLAGIDLTVSQAPAATQLVLAATWPGATTAGLAPYRVDPNPARSNNRLVWQFLWTNIVAAGPYTFHARVDTNGVTNTVEASATRNTTVVFREMVPPSDSDRDDDDDGLWDADEVAAAPAPWIAKTNSENWVNGDVHVYQVYGRTDPLSPDTDGDGLPDGLESGWRQAVDANPTNGTDTGADTDGDGFPNFIGDRDPPFYNTLDNYGKIPGVSSLQEGGDRRKLVQGSMTEPNDPDTDHDGIPDGVEDRNRNGWVDGDGSALAPGQDPETRAAWPDRAWDAAWQETDPLNSDTDRDGAGDGAEDADRDGVIDGDTNSNRVWNANERWTETNPLNPDTDGDGLPDGWEIQYRLNPLDDGVAGHTNMGTGAVIATNENGATGNPDGDTILVGTNAVPYTNLLEYQNNTNPRQFDGGAPPPAGSITIGRGRVLGVLGGVTNFEEFADWTWDDLVALDEYEGDGRNNQAGDVYPAYDSFDTSRDIVAFYARDGGGAADRFYFRVDFHDLQTLAEEGNLDIYVVIDAGNPSAGEMALPDDVDLRTSNRWEAVVAAYQSGKGRVYVDTAPLNNSTLESHGANLAAFGVEARDESHPYGFKGSYYHAGLDAVEFAISRQALRDAGWNGLDARSLNYQVFVTKDGTCNSCGAGGVPGAGDIGGRNDVRDTIYDDEVAEDYWQSQGSIRNTLGYWFPGSNHPGRAKVAFVLHGSQAIRPGSETMARVNDSQGAGYYRALDAHPLYGQKLTLHVTPALASAIEWAQADPAAGVPWRDGPSFNRRIGALVASNTVDLLGSVFADHVPAYFTPAYNQNNAEWSRRVLGAIYGASFAAAAPFWTPERVLDADTFGKIAAMGYGYTVLDQDTHLFGWLGRNTALGEDGYRLNRINGIACFAIHDGPTSYRFQNYGGGLPMSLRALFSRKARSGTQDQVVTVFGNWEDFGVHAQADAYDANLRWIANHPWIRAVSLEEIAAGQVDITGDGVGDSWYVLDRGAAAGAKTGHNFIQFASEGDYDHWYLGSAAEEGLQSKVFPVRPGVSMPAAYGMLYTGGIVSDAWAAVSSVANTGLYALARSVFGASVFETAFHNEDSGNLDRFSTGTYVYPDATYDTLATFAAQAQAQTRFAAAYRRVDQWAAAAASISGVVAVAEDVDLDGEAEYLLYNDRLFGVFERVGGRLAGVWVRDPLGGRFHQALGAFAGAAGSTSEEEGAYNVETNGAVVAYRTSGLKDWYAGGGFGSGFVNAVYAFAPVSGGWQITSSNGLVRKTVTLVPRAGRFEVAYALTGAMTNQPLYVRTGFSPGLLDLMLRGQATLTDAAVSAGVLRVANTAYVDTVEGSLGYADGGHAAAYNAAAVDDNPGAGVAFDTVNMRNQAHTHQVEIVGSNQFAFSLGFLARPSDYDGDGMPNTFEDAYPFLDPLNPADGALDYDGDGVSNAGEYRAGTSPANAGDVLRITEQSMVGATGVVVRFPTQPQRDYTVYYARQVITPWAAGNTNPIPGTGAEQFWVDDGTTTAPHPLVATTRAYRVEAQLNP